MDVNEIINSLEASYIGDIYDLTIESDIRILAKVKTDKIVDVCNYLKENLQFDHLSCEFGIDYPSRNEIEVVYVIGSYDHPVVLILKVLIPRDNPEVESVVPVYWNANWYERETHDLVGVKYLNHPDLRRLILPPELEGEAPLRKDYEGFPNTTARNLV